MELGTALALVGLVDLIIKFVFHSAVPMTQTDLTTQHPPVPAQRL